MRGIRSLSASKYSQPRLLDQISIFFDYFWSVEFVWFRATIMSFKVCEIVQRAYVDPTRGAVTQRSEPPQPRLLGQTFRFFNYFWSIEFAWIRPTIMPPKVCEIVQRAYVDPTRGAVTQRSEPPQPRLLGQTFRFFNYFWSIEFAWIRPTIMPPKVCGVVSAQELIRAGEGDRILERLK